MEPRQVWDHKLFTSTSAVPSRPHCTPFSLPSNGILSLAPSQVITLTTDAVFAPECTAGANDIIFSDSDAPTTLTDLRDPFYASTIPQCYALAATTVIAYMLVIMLLITPRTFLHQGAVVLGRRGFTNGPSGSDAGIGIGGRPWLQKVAALTVAVSLSIATANTFKVAEQQYNIGIMDAFALQMKVEDGTELKIIRVISDTFLWLAQAQTLIRLFPRQREKIIIKWTAFALITLDALFSILNSFVFDNNSSRPRTFRDAVPALAYLFQLALSLLYCAWVIYYSITKKRFAFYHPQMRNICLVALISLCSVLVPVVFFVLDVSQPTLASWGDYVRWVGAAAASVVVWEWVERIEALERNDKKDGVLGREVFDGDEMIDITPSADFAYVQRQKKRKRKSDGRNEGPGRATGNHGMSWPGVSGRLTNRYKQQQGHDVEANPSHPNSGNGASRHLPPLWPTRPVPAATPVSRTDSASAESTVYAIRYHPISEATPPVRQLDKPITPQNRSSVAIAKGTPSDQDTCPPDKSRIIDSMEEDQDKERRDRRPLAWKALSRVNPFRKNIQEPPIEVSAHTRRPLQAVSGHDPAHRWDFRGKFEDFAVTQAERVREKVRPKADVEALSVTVIPAPTRRRDLAATLGEIEEAERGQNTRRDYFHDEPLPSEGLSRPLSEDTELSRRSNRPNELPTHSARHSITQRGALSFITAIQEDQGTTQVETASLLGEQRSSVARNSRGSSTLNRSSVSGHRDGLPVLSIPAPSRRARSEDE